MEWAWFVTGLVAGIAALVPLLLWTRHAAGQRARLAERRARDAERLAELGSITGGLAHEIKNPLSTVGLNAQLLGEDLAEADLPAQQRDRLLNRLAALRRETDRLAGILADFLQFAGRVRLDPHPADLVEILDEVVDFFHPQCNQAGVILRSNLPETPVTATVDTGLLKQAVLNLLINAVQAIESGPDERADLIVGLEHDAEEARIHVTDTGPGIDEPDLAAIFRPYVSRKPGGTGLGLPTARRIVEEHGGRLTVDSEVGRGSDFVIHLPRRRSQAANRSQ